MEERFMRKAEKYLESSSFPDFPIPKFFIVPAFAA